MAITWDESGLSLDDYNRLKTQDVDAAFQVVAHRYNLEFDSLPATGQSATANNGREFDATSFDGNLYRVADAVVEKYNGSSWSVVSGITLSSLLTAAYPTILVDGGSLFVFELQTTGIKVNSSSDGSTWSGWSTVVTDSTIVFMAATSGTRVHYVVKDTSKNVYNFKCAEYSGGVWSVITSDIQYSYPISSFDAARLPSGEDVLALTAQVPGAVSAKYVNNQVLKYVLVSGGVVAFKYKYQSWSDHIPIDIVDEMSAWRYRNNVRVTVLNGKAFITCYSSDGSQAHPITFYRMYTSLDGYWWSRGEAIPISTTADPYGIILVANGDYVYALNKSTSYRSYSTLFTGLSPTSVQLDITDEIDGEWEMNFDTISQVGMVLNNATGWISNSILNGRHVVALVVKLGYYFPEAENPTLIQMGIMEMDSIQRSDELPDHLLRLTGRDHMAWISDKSQSETFLWKASQMLGADNYADTTGTGYGGLGHTATIEGSFKTANNILQLENNNKEAMAFWSWDDAIWNGIAETAIYLDTAANSEYAGIVIRAQDKDNCRIIKYDQTTDKIQLISRVGGTNTTLASSSTLSWTVKTYYYLRVVYRYSRIIVYSSTDQKTWTQRISYIDTGYAPIIGIAGTPIPKAVPVQAGFAGVIGQGYAKNEDKWTGDPGSPLPPSYDPGTGYTTISDTGTVITGDPIIVDPTKIKLFWLASRFGTYYAIKADTIDLNTGACNWSIMTTFTGVAVWACANPYDYKQRFVVVRGSGQGLYVCNDCWQPGATFSLLASNTTMFGASNRSPDYVCMSHNKKNWILVKCGNMVNVSFDLGATWGTPVAIDGASPNYDTGTSLNESLKVAIANLNGGGSVGYVWAVPNGSGSSNAHSAIYKSANWGQTWSTADSDVDTTANSAQVNLTVPYTLASGVVDDNGSAFTLFMVASNNGGSDRGVILKTSNNGVSTTTVYTDSSLPIPFGGGRRPLVINIENGNQLYCIFINGTSRYLYKSVDEGVSWTDTGIALTSGSSGPAICLWSIGSGDYMMIYDSTGGVGACKLSSNGAASIVDVTPIIATLTYGVNFAEFDLSDYIAPS